MAVSWTPEQQKVIDLRNRNILVSAAAGSGKTAVLVERIKERILDETQPVDIDEMLVVTFTKAAAAQMRERVGAAIEKELMEQPFNVRLQKQLALVHNAQITTIDSFCLYVIRNHFHEIDLEPAFRIADEGELKLLKQDVMTQLLEQEYEKGAESFLRLTDTYATGKSDEGLKTLVLQLYEFAGSYPWPKEWLLECQANYQLDSVTEFMHSPAVEGLLQYVKDMLAGMLEKVELCLRISVEHDGPQAYEKTLNSDLELLQELQKCDSYEALFGRLQTLEFAKLASSRGYDGDVGKLEFVKAARELWKKNLKTIREKYFSRSGEQCVWQLQQIEPIVSALVELTISFMDALTAKKRERNIVDFGDLEHFALQILVDQETKLPTGTAREFQNAYAEIMIDEYQDSNYVQESILRAISRESQGENNIFMVGDVKQSIYRFRLARPELFMEKYDTYSLTGGDCQRVDLHKNFRSRDEILSFTNDIFYQIMHRSIGNVEYDEAAALYPGANFPPSASFCCAGDLPNFLPNEPMFDTEILLADSEDEMLAELEQGDKVTLEAMVIANKIKNLIEHQLVTDEQTKELRPMEYGDVVILLRSLSGYADTFAQVLMDSGIPAHTTSKTGYFSTLEVQTVLNYLRLLDNPLQDIPLAAVLKSPIGNFSDEDLARIRLHSAEMSFCESFFSYIASGKSPTESQSLQGLTQSNANEQRLETDLYEKATAFVGTFEKLREMTADKTIHQLLMAVLEQTGYGDIVAAMPGGKQRQANLSMLIEKAIAYEGSSYRGLFHFIRYIDELQKYDVDFGEADLVSENDQAVRIMSIHKSKGLEFSVVFVSGMGKQFNRQDTRSRMILHPKLGIGVDEIDSERRLKIPAVMKQLIANQSELENLGEELRVLYVALTRPQEKLILTGVCAHLEKLVEEYQIASTFRRGLQGELSAGNQPAVGFLDVAGAKNYLELVLMAAVSYNEKYQIQQIKVADIIRDEASRQSNEKIMPHIRSAEDAESPPHSGKSPSLAFGGKLCSAEDAAVSKEMKAFVAERLSYQYPYADSIDLQMKYSVSELKHRKMREKFIEAEADMVPTFLEKPIIPYIPAFMSSEENEVNQGALRGTAVHRVLECLDFAVLGDDLENELASQLQTMLDKNRITPQMRQLVNPDGLVKFLMSPLGLRMRAAARRGELFREKPFVLGIQEVESAELILVQGIIDVFWQEDGKIVLLDYKTDRVNSPQQLIEMYQEQLELYGKALCSVWNKKVEEKYLYSFSLGKAVLLP